MKTKKHIAAAALAFALVACKGTEPSSDPAVAVPSAAGQAELASAPVNAKCPIMGGDVDPSGELASYEGHSIGFCCEGCKPEWESWDAAKKTAFVTEAMKK